MQLSGGADRISNVSFFFADSFYAAGFAGISVDIKQYRIQCRSPFAYRQPVRKAG
jgi:hypothetical protein